jgi:cytochrome c oxidase cbb3-type subunit 3
VKARALPRFTFFLCASVSLWLSFVACEKERRDFRGAPEDARLPQQGQTSPMQQGSVARSHEGDAPHQASAYDVSEGQRLYQWFNCHGCHFNGGGGIGPPFMDGYWTYGGDPRSIYTSIVEGRPNGMPAWKGRIPEKQVWQLVAYVRTLSGDQPAYVASGRSDHMYAKPRGQPR